MYFIGSVGQGRIPVGHWGVTDKATGYSWQKSTVTQRKGLGVWVGGRKEVLQNPAPNPPPSQQ